jgi:mannose/fructose/N-acetylgalactosamine-specific phosphotransferase system component IIC
MQILVPHSKPAVTSYLHAYIPSFDYSVLGLLFILYKLQKIKDWVGIVIAIIYPFVAAAICGLVFGLMFTSIVVGWYIFFIVLGIWLLYYLLIFVASALSGNKKIKSAPDAQN